jgi:hypothetical protein
MRNVLVPEVILDQPGVRAPVSERVTASMPKHVRVDFQLPEASSICILLNQYADRESGEWFATFRKEQKIGVWLHLVPSFEPSIHSADFAVVHWLSGGVPVQPRRLQASPC